MVVRKSKVFKITILHFSLEKVFLDKKLKTTCKIIAQYVKTLIKLKRGKITVKDYIRKKSDAL